MEGARAEGQTLTNSISLPADLGAPRPQGRPEGTAPGPRPAPRPELGPPLGPRSWGPGWGQAARVPGAGSPARGRRSRPMPIRHYPRAVQRNWVRRRLDSSPMASWLTASTRGSRPEVLPKSSRSPPQAIPKSSRSHREVIAKSSRSQCPLAKSVSSREVSVLSRSQCPLAK